jgi:hypothetical protein
MLLGFSESTKIYPDTKQLQILFLDLIPGLSVERSEVWQEDGEWLELRYRRENDILFLASWYNTHKLYHPHLSVLHQIHCTFG